MFFDRAVVHATVSTALTVVRFDFGMNAQMYLEIRFACEEFFTFAA